MFTLQKGEDWPCGDKSPSPVLKGVSPIYEIRGKEKIFLDYYSTLFHCHWLSQYLETHKEGKTHYIFDPRSRFYQEPGPWGIGKWLMSSSSQPFNVYPGGKKCMERLEFPKGDKLILRAWITMTIPPIFIVFVYQLCQKPQKGFLRASVSFLCKHRPKYPKNKKHFISLPWFSCKANLPLLSQINFFY